MHRYVNSCERVRARQPKSAGSYRFKRSSRWRLDARPCSEGSGGVGGSPGPVSPVAAVVMQGLAGVLQVLGFVACGSLRSVRCRTWRVWSFPFELSFVGVIVEPKNAAEHALCFHDLARGSASML